MNEKLNIYDNLNVEYSAITSLFKGVYISGVTFRGDLNSSYIGSGQSIINNTIFSYQNNLIDYAQVQINNRIDTNPKLLNFQNNPLSGNNKILTGSTNVSINNNDGGNFKLVQSIKAMNLRQVTVTTSGDNYYNISNLNPVNFNGQYPNRAQSILLIPECVVKLNGISGGTEGRVVTIINGGKFIIILENLNTNSSSNNQFKFKNNKFFILNPNNSITVTYNDNLQKWVDNGNMEDFGMDYLEIFNNNFSGILPSPAAATPSLFDNSTFPLQTKYFSIYGNPSGITTDGTSVYFNNSEQQVCLLRGKNTTAGNRDGRVRIGLPYGTQDKFQKSGTSFVFLSSFRMNPNGPTNGNLDNWSIIFGLNNTDLTSNYTTLTSNNTQDPNLNGGAFWVFNNYNNNSITKYSLQTTGNSTTTQNSSFSITNLYSQNFYDFGIFYKPISGGTIGSVTFFWNNKNGGTSDNFTIEPPIFISADNIKGSPSITFYGNTLFSGNSNLNNISSLFINYMGYKLNKNL
jgi:hypothetical protein